MRDHLPLLILLLPWLTAPLVLAVGFFSTFLARTLSLATLAMSLVLCLKSLGSLAEGPWHYSLGGWAPPWGIELVLSSYACLFACLLLCVSFFALFYSGGFGAYGRVGKWNIRFFPVALLVLTGDLLGLLLVRDAFSFYLLVQAGILSVGFLLVLSFERSWEEVFRFVLVGSLGATLLLWAVLRLCAATGSLHFDDILAQLFISGDGRTALVAGVLVSAAWLYPLCFPGLFFFKDILQQSPPFVLGLLSSGFVRVGAFSLFLFYFFVLNVPGTQPPQTLVFLEHFLVVLSLGMFGLAVRRKDFLEALGALSVAQLGFLFMGFLLGGKTALTGTLIELLSQTLVMAGLFFAAGTFRVNAGPQPFSRMAGLARRRPLTGLSLVVLTASIVGVPPTAGFFGKFYLVLGALEKRDWLLLAVLLATVLFNLVCFIRFIALLFEHRAPEVPLEPPTASSRVPVILMALGVLALGLFHQAVLKNFIEPALPKAFLETPVPNVPFMGKEVE